MKLTLTILTLLTLSSCVTRNYARLEYIRGRAEAMSQCLDVLYLQEKMIKKNTDSSIIEKP